MGEDPAIDQRIIAQHKLEHLLGGAGTSGNGTGTGTSDTGTSSTGSGTSGSGGAGGSGLAPPVLAPLIRIYHHGEQAGGDIAIATESTAAAATAAASATGPDHTCGRSSSVILRHAMRTWLELDVTHTKEEWRVLELELAGRLHV
jgi:hypothetical protein